MKRDTNDPTRPQRLSADARDLGPTYAGSFSIGFVDFIAGEGGVEVPGFAATKHEILELVRYWATKVLDLNFTFFAYDASGSSDWRIWFFANRRLDTITKLIGKEDVRKAFKQAEQAFSQSVDQRAWRIFIDGTPEEREQFQREVEEELARAVRDKTR